ncbi:hypothetical protein CTAYLR_007989 [Chrysophaeum taylorii]|uniref:Choloylglycine hydrolase/NAAA C-terminal domain-containing protein n=1 Tax=Chrysophaeum taylorii TaxID=2483200 RepID=A0AAD7U792_9STRA|nr:hypothetical protein CTAYLR_007989 [Chrysophaeum taylorii]
MLLLPLVVVVGPATACTTVMLPFADDDDQLLVARSMELGLPYSWMDAWKINVWPRSEANAYGFVGVDFARDAPVLPHPLLYGLCEGMNEHGLTVSTQTLHQASYERANPARRDVRFSSFVALVLGSCRNVADVRVLLRHNVSIVGGDLAGQHWALADADGRAAIVECLNGNLYFHENVTDVGVLTNDPDYVWHLRHLNYYAAFPSSDPMETFAFPASSEIGVVPALLNRGAANLPGGYQPADRFVKAFLLKKLAYGRDDATKNLDFAVRLATGILNAVHIPVGAVAKTSPTDFLEFTNWAVLKVPSQRLFYYRSYEDMQWKQLDLTAVDFSSPNYDPINVFDGSGIERISFNNNNNIKNKVGGVTSLYES